MAAFWLLVSALPTYLPVGKEKQLLYRRMKEGQLGREGGGMVRRESLPSLSDTVPSERIALNRIESYGSSEQRYCAHC
jgi:hypothetical protein